MMNRVDIYNTTQQQHTLQNASRNPVPDIRAERIVKKAKAMISLKENISIQAINLIQMAETALKNGNHVSANNFAQKVLQMLIPGDTDKFLFKRIQLPEPEISGRGKTLPGRKKHTEHTYQDKSNDPGVSFTYPGRLTGPESFLAVPAHEYEHVRRSLREAILNGKRVLVYVRYKIRYDPATGEPYMAGGVTTTRHLPDIPVPVKGKAVDTYA